MMLVLAAGTPAAFLYFVKERGRRSKEGGAGKAAP